MSGEVLVRVEGVSKKFCRSLKRSLWYGVQDMLYELNPFTSGNGHEQPPASGTTTNGLRPAEFWAVRNASFELKRGECLGLIGPNGAGKTTLLKMLNGLIKPDGGRIEMRGRVGALISLGTGFNPILTGRENIYVNGSILGLTRKEIDEKIHDIIDFADIGDFIDTPIQSYSSGMQVRLGFAVATALDPDVLILDEVLAVGDASFRHKCYHRINQLLKNAAVILVSHSMGAISAVCTSVMLMRHGEGQWFPDPIDGVRAYIEENQTSVDIDGGKVEALYPPIKSVAVRLPQMPIRYGSEMNVEIEIESDADIDNMVLSFTALNASEQPVMNWDTGRSGRDVSIQRGRQLIRFSISPVLLHPGRYSWNFSASRHGAIEFCIWLMRGGEFMVEADFGLYGDIPYLPTVGASEAIMLTKP
jgi:lipopolysaccharide transport system ATP-binding protein